MTRQEKASAKLNRAAILDHGAQVFYDEGFSSCNLAVIAQRAGLTRGALYWHFKSKNDLLRALIQERCFTFLDDLISFYYEGDDVYSTLCKIIDHILLGNGELMKTHREASLWQNLIAERPKGMEDELKSMDQTFELLFANHTHLLEHGQAMGTVRSEIDTYVESLAFYTYIWGHFLVLPRWWGFDLEGNAVRDFIKTRLVDTLRPASQSSLADPPMVAHSTTASASPTNPT